MLLERRLSGRQASTSCSRPQPSVLARPSSRCISQTSQTNQNVGQAQPRSVVVARVSNERAFTDSGHEIHDNHFEIVGKHNAEPDYDDPEWFKKVTDWTEFWNATKWMDEFDDLDDEVDAGGKPLYDMDRVYKMLNALKTIETRGDVVNWIPPARNRQHIDDWEVPPIAPEKQEELPKMDLNDARALAEKRRKKELMDLEWRRRQDKIGKISYPDPWRDFRLAEHARGRREWSHEEVYALITQNGTACRPEDHQAIVENPLVPVDYPNVMGVRYIEETEEFLERIGHLGEVDEIPQLDEEILIDLSDPRFPADVAAALLADDFDAVEQAKRERRLRKMDNTWRGDYYLAEDEIEADKEQEYISLRD